MSLEIKGLELLGADFDGASELAEARAKTEERKAWLLAIGVRMFQLIMARGGNLPGRIRGDNKSARRAKVALARKADRSRRARGS